MQQQTPIRRQTGAEGDMTSNASNEAVDRVINCDKRLRHLNENQLKAYQIHPACA
jgi:hypothetical protein